MSPWTARIRPAPSVTVMTPPRLSTSLAIDAAALPSWANTISCSSACSPEDSSSADAGGAALRRGSTWYCSRHRYQDVATSGRTPRTRSSPARNRSRAAVTAWYRSTSVMRWRFAVWLMRGAKVYGARRLLALDAHARALGHCRGADRRAPRQGRRHRNSLPDRSFERRPARAGQLPRDESYPAFLVAKWKVARRTLVPKLQEEVDREVARLHGTRKGSPVRVRQRGDWLSFGEVLPRPHGGSTVACGPRGAAMP